MISMAASLFGEGLPTLEVMKTLLDRKVDLVIEQDNQATIWVAKAGYSSKLRRVSRTHKVDLGSIEEVLDRDSVTIRYVASAEQAADVFTKAVAPTKWEHALEMLNILDADASGAKSYDGAVPSSRIKSDPVVAPEFPGGLVGDHPAVPARLGDVDVSKLAVEIPVIHRGLAVVAEIGEHKARHRS